MPANYILLEKITVGAAGASSVTFSGIPQTGYTDLVVKMSTRTTTAGFRDLRLSLNGSTTGFTNIYLEGNGATAYSGTAAIRYLGTMPGTNVTASTFTNSELYFPNYTSSNFKSYSLDATGENNATTNYQDLLAGLWSNTAAITSIELAPEPTNNFAQYSTFYLYGVAKLGTTPAIVPYATGGDTIMTDGTYWYHTFTSSGTFTPQKAITCDYLVVAGGGGGGSGTGNYGGGGGAGGLRSTVTATGGGGSLETPLSLGTSAYTVTVGAGGAAGVSANKGSQGSNSVFSTITSTGGGFGGGETTNVSGGDGGSGGGRGGGGAGSAGNGTANQGFAGSLAGSGIGGGGGGAGSAASGSTAGSGVAVSITGSSVTYAAGGRGTTGGSTPAANSGGGGLGALSNTAGGSGIVIVRYAV